MRLKKAGGLYMKTKRVINISTFALILAALGFLLISNLTILSPYHTKSLVIEDKIFQENDPFILDNEEVLIDFDIIKEEIDPYIFWDKEVEKVTITTKDKTVRLKTNSLEAMINNKPVSIKIPVKVHNNKPYIPIEFMAEFFNIKISKFIDKDIVVIDFLEKERKVAEISKNTSLKSSPSLLSFNYRKLETGDIVSIYGDKGNWYYVRTKDGAFGFIKKPIETKTVVFKEPDVQREPYDTIWKPEYGKINMVWDHIFKKTPDMKDVEGIKGLDVISPTWFSIIDSEGNIYKKGDINYVNWAHKNGYKVWALIDNSFDPDITSIILNNTELREKVINQILVYAGLYNLDGINIDFENINIKDRDMLTQFIRELAPIMKEQGLVLSMDITVKSLSENWSLCYDRQELAKAVDYLALMAYDEHWGSSPVSGSVASIGWVEKGIVQLLELGVPPQKILLGIPFYTREWQEKVLEDGRLEVKSKALSMDSVKTRIKENDAKITWQQEIGQNFMSYTKNGYTYKIWIEDEKSIALKSSLVKNYDLAGTAAWRKGFEEPQIWDVLHDTLDKKP